MTKNNILAVGWFVFFLATQASAAVSLNQVEIIGGNELNLILSEKLDKSQVEPEFSGEIIQLSLDNVTIYPSKIIPVDGGLITKVFVYQYSPKQVRCRISVKGKAEEYRDRIQLTPNGKTLQFKIAPTKASAPAKVTAPKEITAKPAGDKLVGDKIDEDLLLDKVLKAPSVHPIQESHKQEQVEKNSPQLTSGKSLPPLAPVFLKLGMVILLFVAVAFAIKVLKNKKFGALASTLKKKDGKIIEVVTSHYLGPKKSITLVRVAGRLLVLGVSSESIQLITELNDSLDRHLDESDLDDFSDVLSAEKVKPSLGPTVHSQIAKSDGVRSMIRSRLEGLKPL